MATHCATIVWQDGTHCAAASTDLGPTVHELSLAESAVALIEQAVEREQFKHVRRVRLEIGALSCVDPDALRFAWQSAALGSCAAEAELLMLTTPGLGECPACGQRSAMETLYDLCPHCDGVPLRVCQGTEMRVKDLDVE